MIPKAPFARLVREIMQDCTREQFRITLEALVTIHEFAEIYMTQRFQDAYLLTCHRGRVTLTITDMRILNYFRPI